MTTPQRDGCPLAPSSCRMGVPMPLSAVAVRLSAVDLWFSSHRRSQAIPGRHDCSRSSPAAHLSNIAASGTKVWLVAIGAHGGNARLFVSEDGGRSFSEMTTAGMRGEYCTATATSAERLWGYCIQGNVGYAVRSTDGGSYFSRLVLPPNPSESLDSVVPVSGTEAVFEVPDFDSLWLTRDGGEHFSSTLRSQALYASFLIAFVNATTWLLLGNLSSSGVIGPGPTVMWRSNNAGVSWRRLPAPQGVSTSRGAATPWTSVRCGSDFLSAAESAMFVANFDYPFCVGLQSATDVVWEVMAPGGTVTYTDTGPNPPPKSKVTTTRGGSMVAVLRCPLDDSTCADPNFPHPFSDFTVYPSPDSTTPLRLSTAGYDRALPQLGGWELPGHLRLRDR